MERFEDVTGADGHPDEPETACQEIRYPWVGLPRLFLFGGLVVGLYATAPGFFLGGLNARRGAEIVDHVVPGMVVLAMVYVTIRWGTASTTNRAGTVVLLAGLWMAVAHIEPLRQGLAHGAPWPPVLYHCSSALLVVLLGAEWTWHCRRSPRSF